MTVTQLAKLTGYSISTVSKALSDSDEISAQAKAKILKAARDTGYYNKALQRRKRIGAPRTAGIAADGFGNIRLLDRLCRELESRGIKAVVCTGDDAARVLGDYLAVDTVIFFYTQPEECAVSSILFDGDVYSTVDMIENGLPDDPAYKKAEPQKKEDIWLF